MYAAFLYSEGNVTKQTHGFKRFTLKMKQKKKPKLLVFNSLVMEGWKYDSGFLSIP